ncbi:unnamed protein product, partial [Tetraodon nigroviridis]
FQGDHFLAGWIGGASSVVVGHPLDTVKVTDASGGGNETLPHPKAPSAECVSVVPGADATAGGTQLQEQPPLHDQHLQEGDGRRLLQGDVVSSRQHHRLQFGGVWLLQQRTESHQQVSPWRRAPPLQHVGPDGGQRADRTGVGGAGSPGGSGQNPPADADADGSGRSSSAGPRSTPSGGSP